ncbi:GRF-type domain-containing protein [Abeliophyllum distichum]|uniref:GRF-type domain-containing protein n=1 Tax=Abeliophyllum distichum TaxID=126358 RepID=A0ABD1VVH1_9LAMI
MAMENVNQYGQITEHTMCMCGSTATMRTARTENNPGKRFLGCSFYGRPDACDYFKLVDPIVHPRYKSVINGLLRSANQKDTLEKKLQRNLMYHRILLALVVMVLMFHFVI